MPQNNDDDWQRQEEGEDWDFNNPQPGVDPYESAEDPGDPGEHVNRDLRSPRNRPGGHRRSRPPGSSEPKNLNPSTRSPIKRIPGEDHWQGRRKYSRGKESRGRRRHRCSREQQSGRSRRRPRDSRRRHRNRGDSRRWGPTRTCVGCKTVAHAWAYKCRGCNDAGVCYECEDNIEYLGKLEENQFRCVSCNWKYLTANAAEIEKRIKNQVLGDVKTFSEMATRMEWYAPLARAKKSDLKKAHKQITHPPTHKDLDGGMHDESVASLRDMAQLQAAIQKPGVDKSLYTKAEAKFKIKGRDKVSYKSMTKWSPTQILVHLRTVGSRCSDMAIADKDKAGIWHLASCLAREREFVLENLLEAEKLFEGKKNRTTPKPEYGQVKLKAKDRNVVGDWVTWSRIEAKKLKHAARPNVQLLKSVFFKESLLEAKLHRPEHQVEMLLRHANLVGATAPNDDGNVCPEAPDQPAAHLGLQINGGANAVRQMAKINLVNEINSLLDMYKRDRISGADLFAEAAKKGHGAKMKLSDTLNHRAICRNCIMLNKKFEIAASHPVTLCLEEAQVNCIYCRKGPHWKEDCPVWKAQQRRQGKEIMSRAARVAKDKDLMAAKGDRDGRSSRRRSRSPALSRPRLRKGKGKKGRQGRKRF